MSTTLTRLLSAALPAIFASTFGLQPAHADIYTWIDATGGVSVSNLAPPEGVRVTNVIHASAPKTTARDDDARDAELRALTERVRQVEDEIEAATRQVPAPKTATRDDAARDAELQALKERVRQVEDEVELARRQTSAKLE